MLDTKDWILEQNSNYISLVKWQKTVDLMARLYHAPAGFVVQQTEKGNQFVIASRHQDNPYAAGAQVPLDLNIFCAQVIDVADPVYIPNASVDARSREFCDNSQCGFLSYLGIPILWPDGHPFGTLCVMDCSPTNYKDDYLALFRQIRDMIQDDLALVDGFEKMREMAMLDPLTELYNRRAFYLLGEQQLRLASRMGFDVYCLYIDVNDFKRLNDSYGHDMGDKVLQLLADTLRAVLRKTDITGRLGGDEFVTLLQCHQDHLPHRVIENLHRNFSEKIRPHGTGVSLSIGHTIRDKEQSLSDLLSAADQAMYLQKSKVNRP